MKNIKLISFLSVMFVMAAGAAMAMGVPTDGFAQQLYDTAVTDMLGGPIGFTAGVAAMVLGAVTAMQQKLMASVAPILGGVFLMNADGIVESLGALIM
jgi:hypothetical protein